MDVYDDGRVIVHGVDEFFDPALETLFFYERNIDSSRSDVDKTYGFTYRDFIDYWLKHPYSIAQLSWLHMEVGFVIAWICYIYKYRFVCFKGRELFRQL